MNRPDLLCTHLKHWTLPGVVRTDVTCRALPWARLLLRRSEAVPDLNLRRTEQAKALLAAVLVVATALALAGVVPAWLPAGLALAAWAANRSLFALFRRRRGWLFAVGALAFHQLYYLYSAASFAWCQVEHRLGRLAPGPRSPGAAA